jgi:D-citramalate synthase
VSDLHIEKKMRKTREQVYEMALAGVSYAKERGLIVELSGEDASRADPAFVRQVYAGGLECGADRLCFCDTVGLLTPERVADLIPPLCLAPLSIHCHDDLGMGLANTVAALHAGAGCAHATVNGLGERAGNVAFEELVMALEILYDYRTGIKTSEIYHLSSVVSRLTGVPLPTNKAIVGEMAFTHESGIHAHGVLREPSTYEPVPPEMIGRKRRILLGKHSGSAAIEAALAEFDYRPDEGQLKEIMSRIKDLGDKGMRITDADLMAVAEAVMAIESKPVLTMRQFTVVSGSNVIPTASVTLEVRGEEITGAAIHGGTDALVDVTVRLSKDGKIITSRGARTDIIMASVEAVIAGMNRLLREET